MVRQRQEIVKLPDVSRMLADVKISESRIRQLRPGMAAYVTVDCLPKRIFKARVRKVGVLPDSQASWMNPDVKVYSTEVLIEDELPTLKPGVSARAQIVITNLPNALSVPIQAVTTHRGQHVCYVAKGRSTVPVPVTVGWYNDQFIEIQSGLKEGDRVLLAPPASSERLGSDEPAVAGHDAETNRSTNAQPGPSRNQGGRTKRAAPANEDR